MPPCRKSGAKGDTRGMGGPGGRWMVPKSGLGPERRIGEADRRSPLGPGAGAGLDPDHGGRRARA